MYALGLTCDCRPLTDGPCRGCIWQGHTGICSILRSAARAHRAAGIRVTFTDDIITVRITVRSYTGELIEDRRVRILRQEPDGMDALARMADAWQELEEEKLLGGAACRKPAESAPQPP